MTYEEKRQKLYGELEDFWHDLNGLPYALEGKRVQLVYGRVKSSRETSPSSYRSALKKNEAHGYKLINKAAYLCIF